MTTKVFPPATSVVQSTRRGARPPYATSKYALLCPGACVRFWFPPCARSSKCSRHLCVCVCVVKGNVAGEARDVVQSPLIDSIFVSSSQWMERTSPDTSVPLRANSTILQLDARSLLVRVETGNCSRTIEEMRVPVIEVRCDSLRGALMPVDATLTHPIPCLSVRQSHQPAVGHHRDRFLPTKLH